MVAKEKQLPVPRAAHPKVNILIAFTFAIALLALFQSISFTKSYFDANNTRIETLHQLWSSAASVTAKNNWLVIPDLIDNEQAFQESRYKHLTKLINRDTLLLYQLYNFEVFVKHLDIDELSPNKGAKEFDVPIGVKHKVWNSLKPRVIRENDYCEAARLFRKFGSKKPHVLLTDLWENFGAVSSFVPNRTIDWGTFQKNTEEWGCSVSDVFDYIHHPNMLAFITTQHHEFDHPKVHSIPLGVSVDQEIDDVLRGINASQYTGKDQRPQLLMINNDGRKRARKTGHHYRHDITKMVTRTFRDSGVKVRNTYGYDDMKEYYAEMISSKYVLSPSGLGWDCYRIWEAIYVGTIPVIELYFRADGWRRVLDDLPVLWVDHFSQVTPELLEEEYPKIMAKWRNYKWEKMSMSYWINFVYSFLPKEGEQRQTFEKKISA